jgi:hypothetical protein
MYALLDSRLRGTETCRRPGSALIRGLERDGFRRAAGAARLRASPAQGRADPSQVVPALPERVILHDELRGNRRAERQRERSGPSFRLRVKLRSGEPAARPQAESLRRHSSFRERRRVRCKVGMDSSFEVRGAPIAGVGFSGASFPMGGFEKYYMNSRPTPSWPRNLGKSRPIAVVPEDRPALVAPAGDVVDRAFIFQTKGPHHGPAILHIQDLTPSSSAAKSIPTPVRMFTPGLLGGLTNKFSGRRSRSAATPC